MGRERGICPGQGKPFKRGWRIQGELSFFSYDLAHMGRPLSMLLFIDPNPQNKIYMSQFSLQYP